MLQFIVLGYVPGTTIQLSFIDWLLLVAAGWALLWLCGLLLTFIVQRAFGKLAVNLYPYLKFRRRQNSFTVKLKFG